MEFQQTQNNQPNREDQLDTSKPEGEQVFQNLTAPALSLSLHAISFGPTLRAIKEVFSNPVHQAVVRHVEGSVAGQTMPGPEHMLFDALVRERAAQLR